VEYCYAQNPYFGTLKGLGIENIGRYVSLSFLYLVEKIAEISDHSIDSRYIATTACTTLYFVYVNGSLAFHGCSNVRVKLSESFGIKLFAHCPPPRRAATRNQVYEKILAGGFCEKIA
jgi:hypothetical protein